ncbi:MAG: hypothetical protein ACRENS_03830 [Candidatus Eiseniibacteriota bacterium]
MGLSVSKPTVMFSAKLNGQPITLNPARLFWALAMMGCLGFTIFYTAAAPFLSGKRVTMFQLQSASALELPGITFSKSGPRQEMTGPVALDPSMNTLGLVLHVGHHRSTSSERLNCEIAVRDAAGRVVWENQRVISDRRIGRSGTPSGGTTHVTAMFGTMSVPQADQYTFEVRFGSQYSDAVRSADLEIRRNITGPSPMVLSFAAALALACLVGFLLSGRAPDEAETMPKAA